LVWRSLSHSIFTPGADIMKKLIAVMAMAIFVLIGTQVAGAASSPLLINGVKVEGVTVSKVVMVNGQVKLTASKALVVASDVCGSGQESVGGICVDVCSAGQERVDGICVAVCSEGLERVNGSCVAQCDAGEERNSAGVCEVTSAPPPQTGGCVNTAEVECGFIISKAEWAAESIDYTTVVIPRGKTLVSAINTTDRGSDAYGFIGFAPPFANKNGVLDIWISATPNGPELDAGDCGKEDVSAFFDIEWTATAYQNDCVLTGGQRYFFNMRHTDPNASYSNSQRYVNN
jgi:hypothetical protein